MLCSSPNELRFEVEAVVQRMPYGRLFCEYRLGDLACRAILSILDGLQCAPILDIEQQDWIA